MNEREESVWFVLVKDLFIRTDSVAKDPSLADDGLTHMLDEVFDERLENMSGSSARAPQTSN